MLVLMFPCIAADSFIRLGGNFGTRTKWKGSFFIHPFFIIAWSCISLKPLFLLSCTEHGCSREVSVWDHFVKKITKDHISPADSMTTGLAMSKKSLGLHSPSSKMLFISLVWILVGSLRLPTDPSGPQCRRWGGRSASPASHKELWHNPGVSRSHEKWFVGSGPQGPLFQSRAAIVQPHEAPPAVSVPFKKQSCVVNYWRC